MKKVLIKKAAQSIAKYTEGAPASAPAVGRSASLVEDAVWRTEIAFILKDIGERLGEPLVVVHVVHGGERNPRHPLELITGITDEIAVQRHMEVLIAGKYEQRIGKRASLEAISIEAHGTTRKVSIRIEPQTDVGHDKSSLVSA